MNDFDLQVSIKSDKGYLRDALGVRDRIEDVDDMRREDDLLGSVFVSGCFRRANAIVVFDFNNRAEVVVEDFQEACFTPFKVVAEFWEMRVG